MLEKRTAPPPTHSASGAERLQQRGLLARSVPRGKVGPRRSASIRSSVIFSRTRSASPCSSAACTLLHGELKVGGPLVVGLPGDGSDCESARPRAGSDRQAIAGTPRSTAGSRGRGSRREVGDRRARRRKCRRGRSARAPWPAIPGPLPAGAPRARAPASATRGGSRAAGIHERRFGEVGRDAWLRVETGDEGRTQFLRRCSGRAHRVR